MIFRRSRQRERAERFWIGQTVGQWAKRCRLSPSDAHEALELAQRHYPNSGTAKQIIEGVRCVIGLRLNKRPMP